MSRETRNLTSEEIWVTEYNPQYGTCCGVRNPCAAKEDAPLENEKASSEREAYPRLVRRDATPAVIITDEPGRSRGPSLQACFHAVVAWPNWKLGLGVVISCLIPWTITATIYYVLDKLNVVASMGPDGYQTDDSWSTSFFLTAYTATSVGYGEDRPGTTSEYLGTMFPLTSYHLQILINAFWLAVMIGRITYGEPLSHTVLFANRAVMQETASRGRMFQCRFINLRTKFPWVDVRVQMFYISFDTKGSHVTKKPLLLEEYTGKGRGEWDDASAECLPPFMDVPTYVTHYIPKGSILDMTVDEMTEQRGEVAVMIEGYDPCTGHAVKARFSYIANEIFENDEYTRVLSLSNTGAYEVDLSKFHCTQAQSVRRVGPLETGGSSEWVTQ